MEAFKLLGCNMSSKLYFLPYLANFSTNFGAVSNRLGERFNQNLKVMEERITVHYLNNYFYEHNFSWSKCFSKQYIWLVFTLWLFICPICTTFKRIMLLKKLTWKTKSGVFLDPEAKRYLETSHRLKTTKLLFPSGIC